MAYVVDEIVDLLLRERTRAPIADGLRFAKPNADQVVHEVGKRDRHAVATKRRGELRIERTRRHAVEAIREDLQVALKRVPDDRLIFK
jgi:hypothetical protein